MIEQVGASGLGTTPEMGLSASAGNKPYADLTSIGKDATQFGNANRQPGEEKKSFLGKLIGLGAAIGTIAMAARIPAVRGLLGRIPGKDRLVKLIGDGLIKFRGSKLGQPLIKALRKIPLIGEPLRKLYATGMKAGRHAGKRMAASAGGEAAGGLVKEGAKQVVKKGATAVT